MRNRVFRLAIGLLPFTLLLQTPTNCTIFLDPIRILQGLAFFGDCEAEYDDGVFEELDCDD